MADPRQRHVGKTKAEKTGYIQNILQPSEATAEIPFKKLPQSHGDTTDGQMPEEEQEFYKQKHRPPLPQETRKLNINKYLIPAIIATSIAFLGWLAKTIIDLNREVGEVKIEMSYVKSAKEADSKRLERLEESLNKLNIKLIDRKPKK